MLKGRRIMSEIQEMRCPFCGAKGYKWIDERKMRCKNCYIMFVFQTMEDDKQTEIFEMRPIENELAEEIGRLEAIISGIAKHITCHQQADDYTVDIMHIANYCERCWSKDECEHSDARHE